MFEASLIGKDGRRGSSYVRLKSDIPAGLPPVRIAPHRLTQAMLNLVHNARDAILIARAQDAQRSTSRDAHGGDCISIEARATEDRHAVLFKVIDDGCGMDEPTRQRAIEPFFTTKNRPTPGNAPAPGSATGSATGMGSGMGLALAQRICDQVGGSLDIESVLGDGTTITLTLPAATAQG